MADVATFGRARVDLDEARAAGARAKADAKDIDHRISGTWLYEAFFEKAFGVPRKEWHAREKAPATQAVGSGVTGGTNRRHMPPDKEG